MKKTILIFACIFFAGIVFCGHAFSESYYSPSKPVIITNPSKNLDEVDSRDIPEFLKKWEKLPVNAGFREKIAQDMQVFNWADSYYLGDISFINTAISFIVKVPARDWEFTMVFSEYRWENGKINFYRQGGSKEITPQEFERIKYVYAQKVCESAEYLSGKLIKDLRGKVVENIKNRLVKYKVISKDDDFEQKLAQIPKFKFANGKKEFHISADEMMLIPPAFVFGDFCPQKVVITPISMGRGGIILGLSYPDSGVVLYHPVALIYNYLKLHDTFTHELVHRNKYLQGLLIARQTDVETWASFSERLGGNFEYLFHPYQKTSREIGNIITSFDALKAGRKIIKYNLGGSLDIDDEASKDYGGKAGLIFDSFRETMYSRFIQSFYSDPLFWGCVNDDLYDDNGSLKTFFYTRYAFSLLGGPEKTSKWLDDHEEVIKEAYEEARKTIELKRKKDKAENNPRKTNHDEITNFLLKHKNFLDTYSSLLGLPEVSSDSWKAEKIKTMLRLGVIGMPQVMTPISLEEVNKWKE